MSFQKLAYLISYCLLLAHFLKAGELPEGFEEKLIAEGLDPTALTISPDGKIFFVEKKGLVWIVENDEIHPEPLLKIPVDNINERGLGGIAIDPDFENNHYFYLYYTVPNQNRNRVSRFTVNENTAAPESELILLELDSLSATLHNGGAMTFASDGKLYIATGDGGRRSNSKELDNLLGKILRINKDGTIPSDNPFYNQASGKNRAIWAYGLRNPFSFDYDPVSGRFFVNDVGGEGAEEINELEKGANYGWPLREGFSHRANQPENYKNPLYTYGRESGCAIIGAAFYNPLFPTFPERYHGKYFFADFCDGYIKVLDPETGEEMETFATNIKRPLGFKVAEDGSFYYINRGDAGHNTSSRDGSIRKITYSGTQSPHITLQPAAVNALVGDDVKFSIGAGGQEPLSFQWYKNDVILPEEKSSSLTVEKVGLDDNGDQYHCVVSNEFGSVTSKKVKLSVIDNTLAEVSIEIINPTGEYKGGDTLRFSGSATDAEDGELQASAFTWWIDFHHDDHTHPALDPVENIETGYYVIPRLGETSDNVWYRVYLEVKDSHGFTSTAYEEIFPLKADFELLTQPEALSVFLDGSPTTTPTTITSVVGITRTIGAPPFQENNGKYYFFKNWSDGKTEEEIEFNMPEENSSWTAIFREAIPGNGDGLSAAYYEAESDFTGDPAIERIDDIIDLDWDLEEIPENNFKAKWEGQIQPLDSGWHTFFVVAKGGVRLWVNEELIIDEWENSSVEKSGIIALEHGKFYDLVMEYTKDQEDLNLKLEWETEKLNRVLIPTSQMYSINAVTSVEPELDLLKEYKIYPVPADDVLNIVRDISSNTLLEEIAIHNTLGAVVLKQKPEKIDHHEWQINVSILPAGIYFIRSNKGSVLKFLKN
jgi:glucose/arabinose dehydrogenase